MNFNLLFKKAEKGRNIEDLTSAEEKKILKKAATGANALQKDLVNEYNRLKATSISNN